MSGVYFCFRLQGTSGFTIKKRRLFFYLPFLIILWREKRKPANGIASTYGYKNIVFLLRVNGCRDYKNTLVGATFLQFSDFGSEGRQFVFYSISNDFGVSFRKFTFHVFTSSSCTISGNPFNDFSKGCLSRRILFG